MYISNAAWEDLLGIPEMRKRKQQVAYAVSKLKEMRAPPVIRNGCGYVNPVVWADLMGEMPFLSLRRRENASGCAHENGPAHPPEEFSCSCSNPACDLPNGFNCRNPI